MIKAFFRSVSAPEPIPPVENKYHPMPPTLKSQFDVLFDIIVKAERTPKDIAGIIALYALSVGFKTDFRSNYFTYSRYVGGRPTSISFSNDIDYQNSILDFSFCGKCKVRFTIRKKGDEMWLGVVGDTRDLDESHSMTRGAGGQWGLYCGRTRDHYHSPVDDDKRITREEMLTLFKPELNVRGLSSGGYGSFHFPNYLVHRLVPVNTGDMVDMEVDAVEKTLTVIVNGVLQACSVAKDMPDKLAFFVQLDYTDDEVEFEILDFSFKKNKSGRNRSVDKYVE